MILVVHTYQPGDLPENFYLVQRRAVNEMN